MEPNEALGIAAQVAVTLAGFAGVVGAFRPGAIHEWSRLDRLRLRLLLFNALCPLAYALFGMFLLTVKPTPLWIWRECSLFAILFQVPGSIRVYKMSRKMSPAELKGTRQGLFYGLGAIAAAIMVLQFINIIKLNLFWPFFLSIIWQLMAGVLQFARMVLLLPEKE
jgi:hypothetical protein